LIDLKELAANDRRLVGEIEFHRRSMHAVGQLRSDTMKELRETMAVPEIATDMGVTRQEVYRLLRKTK
jgi:hypothetical protein